MRTIDSFSLKIATHIKSVVPDHPASVPVLKHGLGIVINTISIIVFTMGISLLTGKVSETIQAMISFALLRKVVGGYHLKSNEMCIIVSTAMLTALSFAKVDYKWILILSILSIVLIIIYAPSRVEGRTRIKKEHHSKLKVVGVLIVALNLWLALPVVGVSFFVQCLTLIRGGEKSEETIQQN